MRARNIKPDFFRDVELAEVTIEARYLFIGLWCLADREGKLKDKPKQIRFEVFPETKTKDDIETLLKSLVEHDLIIRYSVENNKYIKVVNFLRHQTPHTTEKKSEIPEPHVTSRDLTLSNVDIALNPDSLNPELGIRNPELGLGASPKNGDASPFFVCPFFEVDKAFRGKLSNEYPAMTDDLLLKEFSRMEDWLIDNPKPKRANGHLKNPKLFIKNWLNRVVISPQQSKPQWQKDVEADILKRSGWDDQGNL